MKRILAFFLSALIVSPLSLFAVEANEFLDQNLVSGLEYTVTTGEPIEYSYLKRQQDGTPFESDSGQLTDTNFAGLTPDSGAWYRACRGKSRTVSFDLGSVCAVSCVEAGFLHSKSDGIYAPRYINVMLSENGTDYDTVAGYITYFDQSEPETTRYNAVITLGDIFMARYVRVEYNCDELVYCDEIRVIGGREYTGATARLTPDASTDPEGYLRSLGNSVNTVMLYENMLDYEHLLPYVGYIDRNGDIGGVMFDSAVVIPDSVSEPHTLFEDGKGMDLLEQTAEAVYTALALDSRLAVYIALPYPVIMSDPIGDGEEGHFRTADERIAYVERCVQECITAFREKSYKHIELKGFYLTCDRIDHSYSTQESEVVLGINRSIAQKGYTCFYSSSYLASGFDEWREHGFGGAVMSPDLLKDENGYFVPEMLSELAQTAFSNRLGIEIELDTESALAEDSYLVSGIEYERLLYHGYKDEYMNSFKLFDLGSALYDLCHSDKSTPRGIYLRRLYDITYSFVHLIYKNESPSISIDQDIEMVYGDKSVNIDIGITDTDSHYDNIRLEFPTAPKHGLVASAAGNKTVIYSPDADFLGEDSFTVCVSDGFNRSEEITIHLTVVAPEIPSGAGVEQSFSDTKSVGEHIDEEMPSVLIVILVILGSAIFVVPVVMIIRRKK